jgi:hypothetical protein
VAPVGTGFSGGIVSTTITDAETISLSGTTSILETGVSATLTATISGGGGTLDLSGSGALTLDVAFTGTATNATDYTNVASFTIADGAATGTFAVASIPDFNIEGDETVTATISNTTVPVAGVTFVTDNQTVTITDNESITFSGGTSINETGGNATLTARIDGVVLVYLPLNAVLTLNVAYTGTATNGIDYVNVGSFTIADGALSGTFDITSIADTDIEPDETVIATISTAYPGVTFGPDNQTVTIFDDDFLTAPVNGLTGVSVEPTFTWVTPTGATAYDIKISTAGSNQIAFDAAVIATESGIPDLFYSFTEAHISAIFPLNNNTMYYWQVIPNVGSPSEIFHFTTIPSVPVTKTLPLDASIVNMTDVTFYWYIIGSQGSMKFKIQVKESALTPTSTEWLTPDFEATTFTSNKKFVLLQGKKYYWRVIVLSSGNDVIDYSSVWSFTTGGGALVTPYQTWPIGNAVLYTNTPTLYWYLGTYAPGVTFQVNYSTSSAVDGFGELNAGIFAKYPLDGNMLASGSTDLYLTLPALSPGITYYWQVRAFYPLTGEFGPWSSVESFITHGSGTLLTPFLSYPVGNVTQYTTAPMLYWYVLGQGSGLTYDVYYKKTSDPTFTGPVHQGPELNFQLTNLVAGEQYEWYVESNNGFGTMASGHEFFHITGGVSNGYPVITWPVGNPTVYTTKPTINWFIEGSQLGLTDVVLRYKLGSNSSDWNTVYDGTVTIPISTLFYTFPTDLTEGSTYYFALATKDLASNYSAWDQDAFTVYTAIGNISDPILTSPVGGINLGTRSPTLYWYVIGDLNGVQSYEVTYSTSDVFAAGPTVVVAGVTNPYLALAGLTPGATYHWKVRTLYTNLSYSNYSVMETFRVDPGSNAIQPIIGGPNNVVVNTTAPTISWVLPSEHSATLNSEIVIADNPEMMNAITIKDIANSNYDISDLESGKSYFWKVRTKTEDNVYSEYSGQGVFKIGDNLTDVEVPSIIPDKFSVSQNYPNPFNPSTVINYSVPDAQFVTIRVYNMLGQEIATLVNEEVEAGIYNVTWNGVDNSGIKVATGTYIYRVVAGSNVATKKMILLK